MASCRLVRWVLTKITIGNSVVSSSILLVIRFVHRSSNVVDCASSPTHSLQGCEADMYNASGAAQAVSNIRIFDQDERNL